MFNQKYESAMKKKTLLFAGLCALCLCTWEVQAANSNLVSINIMDDNDIVPTGYEIILLKGDLAAKTEAAASFNEEPICRLIMERVNEGQFKSKVDYVNYKDSALDKQQLLDLRLAAERHFSQFTVRLKKAYPELTNSDLDYCCLYLLGLTDADIAALMQRAYSTVSERSHKLKAVFDSDDALSITLKAFAEA